MGAIFAIVFIGIFFIAIEEIQRSDDRESSLVVLSLANSCAEEALNKTKRDINYGGDEEILINENSCTILPIDSFENITIVKAKGERSGYVKRIQIDINTSNHPELEIINWREVANFTEL